jgi:ubiquinone/menaquinone biosynthesis C-methylase UbiE
MRKFIYGIIRRFWRLAFSALYYPLAPLYDRISAFFFLGQWAKWQASVIPRIQGKRVLEVGCGTGSLLTLLLRRGYKAVGVDASPAMLKQAHRKLVKAGLDGRILRARAQNLPFPDESFETVVCTFPSEYILQPESLQEIARVLYPGGRLVIVDTAILKPFNRRAKFLIRLYGLLGIWATGGSKNKVQAASTFRLPLTEAGLVRRDETAEDEYGEAHIITALKVW